MGVERLAAEVLALVEAAGCDQCLVWSKSDALVSEPGAVVHAHPAEADCALGMPPCSVPCSAPPLPAARQPSPLPSPLPAATRTLLPGAASQGAGPFPESGFHSAGRQRGGARGGHAPPAPPARRRRGGAALEHGHRGGCAGEHKLLQTPCLPQVLLLLVSCCFGCCSCCPCRPGCCFCCPCRPTSWSLRSRPQLARAAGQKVHAWTANTAHMMHAVLDAGVHAVVTNHPRALAAAVERRLHRCRQRRQEQQLEEQRRQEQEQEQQPPAAAVPSLPPWPGSAATCSDHARSRAPQQLQAPAAAESAAAAAAGAAEPHCVQIVKH